MINILFPIPFINVFIYELIYRLSIKQIRIHLNNISKTKCIVCGKKVVCNTIYCLSCLNFGKKYNTNP